MLALRILKSFESRSKKRTYLPESTDNQGIEINF